MYSWTEGLSEGNIHEEIKDIRPILSSVTDVWDGRSKAVTKNQYGLSELDRRKTKPTPRWIGYQLDKQEKKRSRPEEENDQEIKCC